MNLSNFAAVSAQALLMITSFHAAVFRTGFLEISYSKDRSKTVSLPIGHGFHTTFEFTSLMRV